MSNPPLLLDIDLDFFFEPRQDNMWHPWRDMHSWAAVADLAAALRRAGVSWNGTTAIATDDHADAYWLWQLSPKPRTRIRDAVCVHVDAHADWYDVRGDIVHCGNYLRWALQQGVVGRVYWVMPPYLNPVKYVRNLRKDEVPDVKTLRMEDGYITGTVAGKPIHLVIGLDKLPGLNQRADVVTIASSPGWAPKQAETILAELCAAFGADPQPALEGFRRGCHGLDVLNRLEAPISGEELQSWIRYEAEEAAQKVLAL